MGGNVNEWAIQVSTWMTGHGVAEGNGEVIAGGLNVDDGVVAVVVNEVPTSNKRVA